MARRFSQSTTGGPAAKKSRQSYGEDEHRKYFETQEEYDSWLKKSEKAREEELFERSEAYDERQNREKIIKQLEKRRASHMDESSDSSSASDTDDEIEEKEEKKADLDLNDVYGNSSSSSSSNSSSSSENDSDDDLGHPQDEVLAQEERKRANSKEKILSARLTRSQLAKIVHAPFFNEVVKGSFVLIHAGRVDGIASNFILAEVLAVLDTPKIYTFENATTNKTLKVRNGDHVTNYRLCFVSNTPCNDLEFDEYLRRSIAIGTLPFEDEIDRKREKIAQAMNHRFTNEDIDFMIKEKQRHVKPAENRLAKKRQLLGELLIAQEKRDFNREMAIRQEIAKLDGAVEETAIPTPKPKSEMLASIMMRDHPGRMRYNPIHHPQAATAPAVVGDDSFFTRKKNLTKIVSGRSGI